jgi:uncharacterized protein DUF4148
MKFKLQSALVAGVAAAALIGVLPGTQAAEGKTRAQVLAEYQEAVRTGDIMDPIQVQKLNELYPAAYPAKQAVAKTRSEVAKGEKQDTNTKTN